MKAIQAHMAGSDTIPAEVRDKQELPAPEVETWSKEKLMDAMAKVDDATGARATPDEVQARETIAELLETKWGNLLSERFGVVAGEVAVDTGECEPIAMKPHRVSKKERAIIKEEVDKLLELGVVEKSNSPWAAPILVVPKPNGSGWRPCVDFRRLNQFVKAPAYPLPVIRDILTELEDGEVISVIDLRWGFWNLTVRPEDRAKLAFVTPDGQYEYRRLPMGLKSSPAEFQRFVDQLLKDLKTQGVQAYLDDVIIRTAGTLAEHTSVVQEVLRRMSEADLQINSKKCQWICRRADYLGHTLTKDGVRVMDAKLQAVREYPRPTNAKDVRAWLGFASYYRTFIPDFATIAFPLNELLRKGVPFEWKAPQENAFQKLKTLLTEAPTLELYKPEERQLILQTDASEMGVAAVLTQRKENGLERPVMYASRTLRGAEINYPVREKEALAIVFGVQHFRDLLHGRFFTVETDHESLKHLWLQPVKPSSRLARWMETLQEFDFKVVYRKGADNINADVLSRHPVEGIPLTEVEEKEASRADPMEQVLSCFQVRVDELDHPWREAQEADEALKPVCVALELGACLESVCSSEGAASEYRRDASRLFLHEHTRVLMRRDQTGKCQVVVPRGKRQEVLAAYHGADWAGHLSCSKAEGRLRKRFWWPSMLNDLAQHIRSCWACQAGGDPPRRSTQAELQYWPATEELGDWCIDLYGPMPLSKSGNRWVFGAVERGRRWPELVALKDASASSVSRALFERVVARHGVPIRITSDQGPQFTGQVMKELCRIMGIRKLQTTAYHPQTNSAVERIWPNLSRHLRKLCGDQQQQWDLHLASMEMALRTSEIRTIGISP